MLRFSFAERLIMKCLTKKLKSIDEIAFDLKHVREEEIPDQPLRVLLHNLFERKAIVRKGDYYRLRKPAKKFAV